MSNQFDEVMPFLIQAIIEDFKLSSYSTLYEFWESHRNYYSSVFSVECLAEIDLELT